MRLRERILIETDSDAPQNFERVILENRDRQEAPKWLRK
jgi:hypothetical protein